METPSTNGHAESLFEYWQRQPERARTRTRFFTAFVGKAVGVRVSALVYLVAIHTQKKHRASKNFVAWHKPTVWWSEQLGVSGRQVRRLFLTAREAGFLDFKRSGRGVQAWITSQKVWVEIKRAQPYGRDSVGFDSDGGRNIGYYDLDLARGLGIRAACILDMLERPRRTARDENIANFKAQAEALGIDRDRLDDLVDEAEQKIEKFPYSDGGARPYVDGTEREYRQLDYFGVNYRLPWISPKEADRELRRLFRLGLINRKPHDQAVRSLRGALHIYYSK